MDIYCVYVTIYRGNKLPMFYIGSTSTSKIISGYRGSVQSKRYMSQWKQELSENPHLFTTKIVSYHKTRQEAYDKEEKLQRSLNVVSSEMYVNETFANGGFNLAGKELSQEHKDKLSKIMRSEEMRLKISSNLRKKPAPSTIEKLIISSSGKTATDKTRAKHRKNWESRSKSKIPVTVNGIEYQSKIEARIALGLSRRSFNRLLETS